MIDKIAWVILSEKNRPNRKMRLLAQNFEKKKKEVNLKSDEAVKLMNDIEKAALKGIRFITYIDDEYPEELRHIAYPPPYLYVRGNVSVINHPLKATIVGSREATLYGINVAANFAEELAGNNVCVVSGGARGIDTAAIRGAMRAGGKVIVVIGTGIDVDYPAENRELFEKVCENGAIVSEFPMGMGPLAQNFPVRNRIMSALGDAMVIVEAAAKSGALISANHAMEQGKILFAVPGNIDNPNSAGTNALLRDGAQFALSGSDILFELMEKNPEKYRSAQNWFEEEEEEISYEREEEKSEEKNSVLSSGEMTVVNAINSGKDTYEGILAFCAMEPNKLTSLLTIMEIKGIIKLAFSNRYKIIS